MTDSNAVNGSEVVRGNKVTLTNNMKKYRNFCTALFTDKKVPPEFSDDMRYLCYSPEKCPQTKKFHWQIFLVFKNQHTISGAAKLLKALWNKPVVLQCCRGTPLQNRVYCGAEDYTDEKTKKMKLKNAEFVEYGTIPAQGSRNDLGELVQEVLDGLSISEIIMNNSMMYHKYGRTLEKASEMSNSKKFRNFMTKGTWYWGPTGCGKSHIALQHYKPSTHFVVSLEDYPWMDNYYDQEIVVINDFRGSIKYAELLQMVDKWVYWVRRRCRAPTAFLAKEVIVTSSLHPRDCYCNLAKTDSLEQLYRRFKIIEMKPRVPVGIPE